MLMSGLGNKKDNITVIYTPWSNLKKDGSMAVGQVGFKDPRKVRRILSGSSRLLSLVLGKESPCISEREPYRQSPEQDQSREVPRPGYGKGGEIESLEKERPSGKIGASKRPSHLEWLQTNTYAEEGRGQNSSRAKRKEMAERPRL